MLCRRKGHFSPTTAVSSIRWTAADRGLDHAVEREKHLKPVLNLKNLILSEPSKSVPLSVISQLKERLEIPFRHVEFIRKYPTVFQEYHPGSVGTQPHIKLTPGVSALSSEETLLFQGVLYKQETADRLLKLLMICRVCKIPISVLELLRWDLGLPRDFEKDIIPEFPDYFRIIGGKYRSRNEKVLELVCRINELAISDIETTGVKNGKVDSRFMHSNSFPMENKTKKWLDDWENVPYLSPYENAKHVPSSSPQFNKWILAVLHEILNLFVGKKVERELLLFLGECFGLRSKFKCAISQHPGIFYVSNKMGTQTVVLREAYKRGMLVKRHPLMDVKFKYLKLMNLPKADKGKLREGVTNVENSKGEELDDDNDDGIDSEEEDE